MFRLRHGAALLALTLAACSGTTTGALTQLSDTLVVAQAAAGAYAARPDAMPAITARLAALDDAAQAALSAYRVSGIAADQAAAEAAVAGLTTFLATQVPTMALAARAPGAAR